MKKAIYNALNDVLFISLIALVIMSLLTNQLGISLLSLILFLILVERIERC